MVTKHLIFPSLKIYCLNNETFPCFGHRIRKERLVNKSYRVYISAQRSVYVFVFLMKRQLFSADLPDGINYMETSVINQKMLKQACLFSIQNHRQVRVWE